MKARSQVSGLGETKCIFRGTKFLFLYVQNNFFLGTNLGRNCPRMLPRGCRPGCMKEKQHTRLHYSKAPDQVSVTPLRFAARFVATIVILLFVFF